MMKTVIVGPGALGCLLAASFAQADVWLLDHNHDRARLLNSQGLIFEKDGQTQRLPVVATCEIKELSTADLIILTTKSQDVSGFLQQIQALLKPGALLLFLQNGIAHFPPAVKILHSSTWAAGVTALGATLLAPGYIRHGGQGITRLGFYPSRAQWVKKHTSRKMDAQAPIMLEKTGALFNQAGLPVELSDSIIDHIWAKLLINVGINALTAIYGCANGQLLESAEIKNLMRAAIEEATEVGLQLGINLPADPVEATVEVCRATADNISSMLQDVRRRRRTEIDAINGAVVREADVLGIEVPVNRELVKKIREIEKNF